MLIVLIPALFFIISFIYKEKVHQEYVKNCYKNNKQYMESIVDYFEKYKYDFGIVNDEDVNVPDFSGYKVEYQNWNMSDIGE